MNFKKILYNKYNLYLVLLFFLISTIGSFYMYINKDIHKYMHTYKIELPYVTKLDKNTVRLGVTKIPLMYFYDFNNFLSNNKTVLENCPNFSKNVRLSIWEARNEIDWRFQIKYSKKENIIKCINQIVISIDEKRDAEIEEVKRINDFETFVFEEAVKKIIDNKGFAEFREFIKKEATKIETQNYADSAVLEILAAALKVRIEESEGKEIPTANFSNNFLRGYVFNFIESYKTLKYIKSLTTTKYKKISEEYFLKKNIFKFNISLLFLLVLSIIIINLKYIKKLFER